MQYRANTVFVTYRLIEASGCVRLRLRPGLHFRPHDSPAGNPLSKPYDVTARGNRFEIAGAEMPPLRLCIAERSGVLVLDGGSFYGVEYELERERGYAYSDILWSPGYVRAELNPGEQVALVASTESWESITSANPAQALANEEGRRQRLIEQADPRARTGLAAELVLAADQFVITPTTRVADEARAHAEGDEVRSVIAGYHWFTDWGRDTMISLDGLTLATGRFAEAGCILRTFSHYVQDGLIPNLFPEGQQAGLYHTADATLWYFHAIDRYLRATDDRQTLRALIPILCDIVQHHLSGTRFGIGVDPADGLLAQGQEGYQLTWMDAKVGDWVVTPRRGKAVEINALWYNALSLMSAWKKGDGSLFPSDARGRRSISPPRPSGFAARSTSGSGAGSVDSCSTSSTVPAATTTRCGRTSCWPYRCPIPCCERALAGDRRSLSAAIAHAGRAAVAGAGRARLQVEVRWRPACPRRRVSSGNGVGLAHRPVHRRLAEDTPATARPRREFLAGFSTHLGEACVGTINEIFDAEAPFSPRGCVAQAWSVAEVLRTWLVTSPAASTGAAIAATRQNGGRVSDFASRTIAPP